MAAAEISAADEPFGGRARQMVMKRFALIIHLAALTVLFTTLAQPWAAEKPAGVRRAIETVAKRESVRPAIKLILPHQLQANPEY
ncbi:MAG: hypothetical protein AB3N20_08090 [Rhizobiaceae bacterium]